MDRLPRTVRERDDAAEPEGGVEAVAAAAAAARLDRQLILDRFNEMQRQQHERRRLRRRVMIPGARHPGDASPTGARPRASPRPHGRPAPPARNGRRDRTFIVL